jgi:histidyl-tRNA synthetase
MQTVKGTRDFLPEEMILRQQVIDKIRSVVETFGFQPIETPALETWETLCAKGVGGEDVFKECYNFKDLGGRRIGLRYEMTVSLARMIASNPNINLPFKVYQVGKGWRYGDISKGRTREFVQFDIDVIGADTMLADAEVVACAVKCFDVLGFSDCFVRINNRKTLNSILKASGINENKFVDVLRSIDKIEKIGLKKVKKELKGKGISKTSIDKLMSFIAMNGEPKKLLKEIKGFDGVDELMKIISYLKIMGIDSKIKLDLSLARGLDYYTGTVFEIFSEKGIGKSIAGGGRYNKMIGMLSGKGTSAVGISFGIEGIVETIKERKLIETGKTKVRVFVISVNDKVRNDVLEIVKLLRDNKIETDFDFRSRTLSNQLKYASSMNIPYVVIVGEKELEKKSVKIRDMKIGKEELVKIKDLAKKF